MRQFTSSPMRLVPFPVLMVLMIWVTGAPRSSAAAEAKEVKPDGPAGNRPALFLIGDSTVKNHTAGLLGWGDPIADFFDPAKIRVENRALGGRSSRTFRTEGLWDKVLADVKPGDFVLMQFGHNDGGGVSDAHTRASIKGNGDETQEVTDPKTGE
jgi:lysophospholipase L1-like esterase